MKKSIDLIKIQKKSRNREKIRKPEKIPEKLIITSYLISKLSIMWKNVVKTIKSEDLRRIIKKRKKSNFLTSELRWRSKKSRQEKKFLMAKPQFSEVWAFRGTTENGVRPWENCWRAKNFFSMCHWWSMRLTCIVLHCPF